MGSMGAFRLASLLALAMPCAAQTPVGDAYVCHKAAVAPAAPPFTPQNRTLEDGFGERAVDVKGVAALCAPAALATHPDVSLAAYKLTPVRPPAQPKFVKRDRAARDALGAHRLAVLKPMDVRSPAATLVGGGVPAPVDTSGVDRFQCYKVRPARGAAPFAPPPPVEITDPFGTRTLTLIKPTRLCAPADAAGADPTAPQHLGHLLCYKAKVAGGDAPAAQTVAVDSVDFGAGLWRTTSLQELCLPAFAEARTPLEDGQAWGDCRRLTGDPTGAVLSQIDDADQPSIVAHCTAPACVNGVPTSAPVPEGGACAESGGNQCDGNGACVAAGGPSGFCPAAWIGDGRCDADCNVIAYGLDGGDCCPGTCMAGRPFPCGSAGYNCLGNPRACLFLHGLGVAGPGQFQSSPPLVTLAGETRPYWGDLGALLGAVCGPAVYASFDTIDHGWDDAALQDAYYARALLTFNAGGVVFAHGMANNVLAGACLQQGKCSVRWIALGAPLRGASAAAIPGALAPVFGSAATSVAAASLAPDYLPIAFASPPQADGAMLGVTAPLVSAAACGTDAWGGGGASGAGLVAARASAAGTWACAHVDPDLPGVCYRWQATSHDGIVAEDDCGALAPGGTLSSDPSANWFAAAAHHLELTGRDGNRSGILDWIVARAAD